MVNHSALCRSIKYDYINILTWTILKKIQILNGCETFAFKYISEMLESILKIFVLENKYKIVVPLFGAAYAASNKGTTILY